MNTSSAPSSAPQGWSSPVEALPTVTAADRVAALRSACDEAGLDAMIITEATSVRWLSGFSGSNGDVVVGEELTLITDGRYRDQAPAEMEAVSVPGKVVVTQTETKKAIIKACGDAKRVGIDPDHVSWNDALSLQKAVEASSSRFELVPTPRVLSRLRQHKDDAEIARIEAAAAITDAALASVSAMIRPGIEERELAAALDAAMRERGASASAFETIVASGPNGALPHHRPGTRAFEDGDVVIIDVGAMVDGYRSDMTRTVAVGSIDAAMRELWDLVVHAQQAGFEAATTQAPLVSIDQACRSTISAAGYGDQFMHGTGHGVGLDIHEEPMINSRSVGKAETGMVITIEPGVYLPDRGGVRIEDTVVITQAGARRVTAAPKSLAPSALIGD